MSKLQNRTTLLTQDQIDAWFETHLPYLRVSLTNHLRVCEDTTLFGSMSEPERHRVRICAYEVGVLTCRKFIEFPGLSIKYNPYQLIEKRDYYAPEDKKSYEVKVTDLGGEWVEISRLTTKKKNFYKKYI